MDDNSIKANVAKRRKDTNLSQSEMAERLGISRNAYRDIESGKTRIINKYIPEIAKILGISTYSLLVDGETEDSASGLLEDERPSGRDDALARLKEENERLTELVKVLKKHIAAQDEIIRNKEEIIALLKKVDYDSRNR